MFAKNALTQFVVVVLVGAVVIGIGMIAYESFIRTWDFFADTEGNVGYAFWVAITFQFGQNVALFLAVAARDSGHPIIEKICYFAYGIACIIDGGTNISERVQIAESLGTYSLVNWSIGILTDVAIVFGEEAIVDVGSIFFRELGKFVQYAFGVDIEMFHLIGEGNNSMGLSRSVQNVRTDFNNSQQRQNQPRDNKQQNRPRLP